jgi:hypothetical protein
MGRARTNLRPRMHDSLRLFAMQNSEVDSCTRFHNLPDPSHSSRIEKVPKVCELQGIVVVWGPWFVERLQGQLRCLVCVGVDLNEPVHACQSSSEQ